MLREDNEFGLEVVDPAKDPLATQDHWQGPLPEIQILKKHYRLKLRGIEGRRFVFKAGMTNPQGKNLLGFLRLRQRYWHIQIWPRRLELP